MKSSSVSKGKLKLKDFIDSSNRCGCKLLHRIPDPSILMEGGKIKMKRKHSISDTATVCYCATINHRLGSISNN